MTNPEEYYNVPLVVYVKGERKVIGEATIQGSEISAVLDGEAAALVIKHLDLGLSDFSIGAFPFIPHPRKKDKQWRVTKAT